MMKHVRIWGLLALVALIISLPFVVGDPTFTSTGVYILLYTAAAVAWNLFSGFTGYINLGSAAYLGIGGYAMAILCQDLNIQGGYGPFFVLPLAGLIAAVCAIPLGWLALRLRRYAFIVMTIAIFYIGQYLAYNLGGLTNGATGIFLPNPPWDAYFFNIPFYYVALALLVLVAFTSWWLRSSKYGLGLFAIRDDEERASGLGVKTDHYKLYAYILSSFFIGMVGAMIVYYTGTVYPYSVFNTNFNISMAVITFIGGIGTVFGPIVGGLLLVPLQQYLDTQFSSIAANFGLVVFGSILLLTVLLLPEGIVPTLSKYGKKWISMINSKHSEQRLQATFSAPVITSQLQAGLIVSRATVVESVVFEQPSIKPVWTIPHRLPEQPVPVTVVVADNPKLRARRLVPVSHAESMTMQEQMVVPRVVSWRCPYCQRPFLLSGNTCYCPRCGFTRPLAERSTN